MEQQELASGPPLDPKTIAFADEQSLQWPDDIAAPKRGVRPAKDAAPHALDMPVDADVASGLTMQVDLTAVPDDMALPKPVIQLLDKQENITDDSSAWEVAEETVQLLSMPPNWDEDVALEPIGSELVRLPRNAQIKVANTNAVTAPLLEPRPGCDMQLWFLSMPGEPPESGVLRQRWLARARYLRVAIASAATHRARLMPVVVFVGLWSLLVSVCCTSP